MTPELAPSLVPAAPSESPAAPVWTPSDDDVERSNLAAFVAGLRGRVPALAGLDPREYERLHAWSVAEPAEFWAAVWRYADVVADVLGGEGGHGVLILGPRAVERLESY